MKIVNWVIQIVVVIAFLGAGMMKLITPYSELITDPNMAWANDFSATTVMAIGVLEVLGALGLIIPMFVASMRKLVPFAAIGLSLTMAGAAVTHITRGEPFIIPVILLLLALYIAKARWI